MKHESERDYVSRAEMIDNAGAWERGSMYSRGLGGDSMGEGDDDLMAVTPSGAATSWSAPSAAAASWTDAFKTAAPILASVLQQGQLTKLNVARINANQPPLTAQEYARVYQPPSAQVQFGVTENAQRGLLYVGIGLAALVGLRAFKVI